MHNLQMLIFKYITENSSNFQFEWNHEINRTYKFLLKYISSKSFSAFSSWTGMYGIEKNLVVGLLISFFFSNWCKMYFHFFWYFFLIYLSMSQTSQIPGSTFYSFAISCSFIILHTSVAIIKNSKQFYILTRVDY